MQLLERPREFYRQHQRWAPIAFFVVGFIFDAIMLTRIDEGFTIIQEVIYLALCAVLIRVELIEKVREVSPRWIPQGLWKHREEFLHFLMGTLMNAYTLFYFKSASAWTSFLFIAALAGLLVVNEFSRFGQWQTHVHCAFLSLCSICLFATLAPIFWGQIGTTPFLLANLAALVFFWVFLKSLPTELTKVSLHRSPLFLPFIVPQVVFVLLYLGGLIPPVPLSLKSIGIYHEVHRHKEDNKETKYELVYTRPWYYFWQKGDQTFVARPGDKVHCFVRVFAPMRFQDRLYVRWLYHDPRQGWQSTDAIPIPVQGSREEGYRAVTQKENYQEGDWRVQIETADGRELGRIGFAVVMDASTEPRATSSDWDGGVE